MKIAIFTEVYRPSTNGVVVSIETFRNALEQLGHTVFLIAPAAQQHDYREPQDLQGRVFRLPALTIPTYFDYPIPLPPPLTMLWERQLFGALRTHKIDIVHTQHVFTIGGLGMKFSQQEKIPLVHTEHTLIAEYSQYMPIIKDWIRDALIWRIRSYCNQCERVITPSRPMLKRLQEYGVKTKIDVNPTGIEVEKYSRIDARPIKEHWRIAPRAAIILYVGRLAREKNIDFVLESFARVEQSHPDAHLLLVGDGPQRKEYEQTVSKMQLAQKVTFTGILPHQRVRKLFGAADVFVFPSLTDTQGIVIGEAMAAGTPVVAMRRMGPVDLIEDGQDGFLVPTSRPGEFSERILALLKRRELWEKISAAGKKRARQQLSVATTTGHLVEIYTDVSARFKHIQT